MFYLEYENDTKIVVEIHDVYPATTRPNHSIATSEQWGLGMELEYVITVDTVDQDEKVTASSTTKQIVPAYQLLKKIDERNQEINNLKSQVADLELQVAQLSAQGGTV